MLQEPEPREVKLLSDILALVLSDESGQAGAALEALRRKARQSRVSGGAIKDVFLRIARSAGAEPAGDVGDWTTANLLLAQLRRTVRDQERELADERGNARAIEVALLELRREFSELQERHATAEARRWWWLGGGAAAGALAAGVIAFAGLVLVQPHPPAPVSAAAQAARPEQSSGPVAQAPPATAPAPTLTPAERASVGQFVRSCWMTSTNSVYAGRFPLNVLVQTDETGTIRAARVADADKPRLIDPQFHEFAELAIRSLLEPRCATLPLPASMLGQRRVFDIHFGP